MAQSFGKIYIHLVFNTKYKQPLIAKSIKGDLHRHMIGTLKELGCQTLAINSIEDHVHILFRISRTRSMSEVAEKVKGSSSKWIKLCYPHLDNFYWQRGYGAFSVCEYHVNKIKNYIAKQEKHHAKKLS